MIKVLNLERNEELCSSIMAPSLGSLHWKVGEWFGAGYVLFPKGSPQEGNKAKQLTVLADGFHFSGTHLSH